MTTRALPPSSQHKAGAAGNGKPKKNFLSRTFQKGVEAVSTVGAAAKRPLATAPRPRSDSLVPRDRPAGDGMASLLKRNLPSAEAGFVGGLVDSTEIGKNIEQKVGVKPSSIGFGIAVGARLLGADARTPGLRKAFTAVIDNGVARHSYTAGANVLDAVNNVVNRRSDSTSSGGTQTSGSTEPKSASAGEKGAAPTEA